MAGLAAIPRLATASVAGDRVNLAKSQRMARTREPAPPPTRLVLGRYRLEEAVGSGAFGTVWRATDERLDREVAVKAIPSELAGERAEREIRAAARLAHPGVVTLHEAASDATHTYLVSEFVRGVNLSRLYSEGRASDRDVARIGAALAAALDHAHAHGVIHRDIKPGNILIPDAPRSEAGIVKLADFGIARMSGDASLTATGDVVGTLAYMSPEQAAGHAADELSDLWSLAIVLFEGFAGANPMRGRTPAETARNLAAADPPLLAEARPDLPEELTETLDAALEADPDDRVGMDELGSALAAAVSSLDDEPGTIAPAVTRRNRVIGRQRNGPQVVRVPIEPTDPEGGPPALDETVVNDLGRLSPRPAPDPLLRPGSDPVGFTASPQLPWLRRLVGVLASAGAAALWVEEIAPASQRSSVWVIVACVALATAVLPRLGWFASVMAAAIAMAAEGQPGSAVVLAAAFLPIAPLMWRVPEWWSLPTIAPLLGAPGFAGAWPAVASLASSVWLRAAAGAAGVWQIACVELLLGRSFLGVSGSAEASSAWAASPASAFRLGLMPMFDGALPVLAGIWALAAVVLPLVVTGRNAVTDAVAGALWAVGVAVATALLAGGLTRGVLAGALAGAALTVAWRGFSPKPGNRVGSADRPPTMAMRLSRFR